MELFIIAALIGVLIGICSGLLGIGGGMIMVPLFRLAFDMSAIASTATSLFAIIPTSISGAVTHIRGKTCIPALGIAMGIGGALTSPVGVWLAQIAPSWTVMLAAALVIGYSAITMFLKAWKDRRKAVDGRGTDMPKPPDTASAQRAARDAQPSFEKRELFQGAGIGATAGIVSGFIGVGGGFIMVPLMLAFIGIPMKLASGTSLIAVMILALPATIEQALLGNISYLTGIALVCGSIPGAALGSSLVKRVPEQALRVLFSMFLGIAAILLVVKEFGLIG